VSTRCAELSESECDMFQDVFIATACGMAGAVGTTHQLGRVPLFHVRLTRQGLIHDVSVHAQLVYT